MRGSRELQRYYITECCRESVFKVLNKQEIQQWIFSNETVETYEGRRQHVQLSACCVCFGRACLKLRIEVDTSRNLHLHFAVSEILEPLAKHRWHIAWEHNGSDTRTLISCGPTDRVTQICIWSWDLTVKLTVQRQAQKFQVQSGRVWPTLILSASTDSPWQICNPARSHTSLACISLYWSKHAFMQLNWLPSTVNTVLAIHVLLGWKGEN